MKAIPQALKPTPLGVILLLLILFVQVIYFSATTTTFDMFGEGDGNASPRSQTAFGLGAPVILEQADGTTNVRIDWLTLVFNLGATCALATFLARALPRLTRLRQPAWAYGRVSLIMLAVSFLVSIVISKIYWGYFFSPPAVLPDIYQIAEVKGVMSVKMEADDSGRSRFVMDGEYSLADRLASARKYADEALSGRLLLALDGKKLLPVAWAATLSGLPEPGALIQTGLLADSQPEYDSSSRLWGVVVDGVDGAGTRLIVLGLHGGQVSNDHYPYYEMAFAQQKGGEGFSLVRGQRYFYDAAGMEGFEWYVIWLLLAPLGVGLGFLFFTLYKVFRSIITDETKNPAGVAPAGS